MTIEERAENLFFDIGKMLFGTFALGSVLRTDIAPIWLFAMGFMTSFLCFGAGFFLMLYREKKNNIGG
jgi:hypothetical protein